MKSIKECLLNSPLKHYRWHTAMCILAWCIALTLVGFAVYISVDYGSMLKELRVKYLYETTRAFEVVLAFGLMILFIFLSVHAQFFCMNRIIYALAYQRKANYPHALFISLAKAVGYSIALLVIFVYAAGLLLNSLEDPATVFDVGDRYRCEQAGGEWESFGSSNTICYMRYEDGGKQCISNADCQGDCYVPLQEDIHYNAEGYIQGICAESTLATTCTSVSSIPTPTKETDRKSVSGYCF